MDWQHLAPADFATAVGRRIRRRREVLGKSQRAVADTIAMGPSQYSRMEKGEYLSIRFDQLAKLAGALETSTEYLLLRSDEMGEIPPDLCPGAVSTLAG